MDSVLDPQVSHHGGAVGRGQWMDLPGRGDGGNTIDTSNIRHEDFLIFAGLEKHEPDVVMFITAWW